MVGVQQNDTLVSGTRRQIIGSRQAVNAFEGMFLI